MPPSRSSSRLALAALFVATALHLSAPSAARADEGETMLSLGASGQILYTTLSGGGELTRFAPGGQLSVHHALTDFWKLGGVVRGGAGLLGGPATEFVGQLLLDVHYVIDALSLVPFVSFGVGFLGRELGPDVYEATGQGPAWDFTIHLGGGIDYRPEREWSIGFRARYHIALTDITRTVGPIDLAITASFYLD